MFDGILSQILYAISGFLFGVFACRFGTISVNRMKLLWTEKGFSASFLLAALPALLFLSAAAFLFPAWFAARTETGAFVYLATFIYYTSRNRRRK